MCGVCSENCATHAVLMYRHYICIMSFFHCMASVCRRSLIKRCICFMFVAAHFDSPFAITHTGTYKKSVALAIPFYNAYTENKNVYLLKVEICVHKLIDALCMIVAIFAKRNSLLHLVINARLKIKKKQI